MSVHCECVRIHETIRAVFRTIKTMASAIRRLCQRSYAVVIMTCAAGLGYNELQHGGHCQDTDQANTHRFESPYASTCFSSSRRFSSPASRWHTPSSGTGFTCTTTMRPPPRPVRSHPSAPRLSHRLEHESQAQHRLGGIISVSPQMSLTSAG